MLWSCNAFEIQNGYDLKYSKSHTICSKILFEEFRSSVVAILLMHGSGLHGSSIPHSPFLLPLVTRFLREHSLYLKTRVRFHGLRISGN